MKLDKKQKSKTQKKMVTKGTVVSVSLTPQGPDPRGKQGALEPVLPLSWKGGPLKI